MRSGGAPLAISAALVAAHHLRSAANQDLPVTPAAVLGDDVHQLAGLAHVQSAWRRHVGIVGSPGGVVVVLGDRRHRQPRIVPGDLPQGGQVVELARIAAAEEHVHARVRPQRVRSMTIERSGASPVLPATISTSPPSRSTCKPPCGLDSRHRSPACVSCDDGITDHAAGNRPDVKLDGSAVIWRNSRRQIPPSPRALRHSDIDILAGVVGHRTVELQPNHRQVAGDPQMFDHRAVPPGRPRLGVRGAAHHAGDQVQRLASGGIDGVRPEVGQLGRAASRAAPAALSRNARAAPRICDGRGPAERETPPARRARWATSSP